MFKNYIKIAWRGLLKNKFAALINIGGLSIGMAVALLVGLWIFTELSFDKYHINYNRIVKVMQHQKFNDDIETDNNLPIPLGYQLRSDYASDFKYAVLMELNNHILAVGDKKLNTAGIYMQAEGPEMLTFKMISGSRNGLQDPSSIMLSASNARALFGKADPMNQAVKIDNRLTVKVTGVYEDLPQNTTLSNFSSFVAPWDLYMTSVPYLKKARTTWGMNSWLIIAQLQPNADINTVNKHIKDLKLKGLALNKDDVGLSFKAQLFLQPMSKWHLYDEFKNGINTGGAIQFVWMFGLIGMFVLLLACINFMNLSTARSEKRAKEVGVRKAIGSMRSELIVQFFVESMLLATCAFVLALLITQLALPAFNAIAGRPMKLPLDQSMFWLSCLLCTFATGLIAGSYPALYLSSFKPVKVLKGPFKAGRFSALPRKVLVVTQFSVSVMLIIGTLVVFLEVKHTKNRPVGYSRQGLVHFELKTDDIPKHFEAFRHDLLSSGAAVAVSQSDSPVTDVWSDYSGVMWRGKRSGSQDSFGIIAVDYDYGKTISWQIIDGRDFSRSFPSDSSGMIINEAAAKFMNLKHAVGETIDWNRKYAIVGVVKNMVMKSPFEPVKPTIFRFLRGTGEVTNLRINPKMSISEALQKIKPIYSRYDPESPFEYHFADSEYKMKFNQEERIGKLSGVFTVLAIFISCLGLFGMASFMAEQRSKEIGVRKVLGASVIGLWRLMSTEFVVLIMVSLAIAMPVAAYVMHNWLQSYTYRVGLSWWLFAGTGAGAIILTLLTISYQTIKAAQTNPVKSLKAE
jgi:putative ABC transport system permease protein